MMALKRREEVLMADAARTDRRAGGREVESHREEQ